MSGKGSKRRPSKVPRKQFEDNWDKIFNRKKDDKHKSEENKK